MRRAILRLEIASRDRSAGRGQCARELRFVETQGMLCWRAQVVMREVNGRSRREGKPWAGMMEARPHAVRLTKANRRDRSAPPVRYSSSVSCLTRNHLHMMDCYWQIEDDMYLQYSFCNSKHEHSRASRMLAVESKKGYQMQPKSAPYAGHISGASF